MKRALLVTAPLILATGCYFSKNKEGIGLDPAVVARIEVGKTTKAELLEILGPPTQIIRLLDSEAYVYRHSIQKNTGTILILLNMVRSDQQFDAVTAIISRAGTVTAVGSRFTSDKASYGFPFSD